MLNHDPSLAPDDTRFDVIRVLVDDAAAAARSSTSRSPDVAADGDNDSDSDSDSELSSRTVAELKATLRARGLKVAKP